MNTAMTTPPPLAAAPNWFEAVQERMRGWTLREWCLSGLAVQLFAVLLAEAVIQLWPAGNPDAVNLELSTEMTFVEYQEIDEAPQAKSKDLSDEIVEVEKKQEDEINWNNAVDPTMDFSQRYTAMLDVNQGPDDYPSAARNANLGRVTAAIRLYIDAGGRIRDVRVRNIRSAGGTHAAFEQEFVASIRRLILQKTKLKSRPYKDASGAAQDFVWDTTITFTLQ